MPWMLLTPPPEQPRAVRAVERAVERTHERPAADESRGDGWVVLGDLDTALYQAGLIDVLLERIERPRVIFTGGVAALNALLALEGRALAFRIGWERVRAAHLLGAAALERAPLPRLRRNGGSSFADARLISLEAARGSLAADNGKPELQLLVDGGFVDLHAGSDAAAFAALATSVRQRPTGAALATAIDAGTASGVARLILFGVMARTVGSPEVARALDDARRASLEVVALPLTIPKRPGVLGYLLPGLGRADRLVEGGREAARLWLDERDGARSQF